MNISFPPVFLNKKIEDELKITEKKPSIVNQQRVVSISIDFVKHFQSAGVPLIGITLPLASI